MSRLETIVPVLIMLLLYPILLLGLLAWGAWVATFTRIPRLFGQFAAEVVRGYRNST